MTRAALARATDVVLDRTFVGFSQVGLAVRSRLPGWPADPSPDALVDRQVAVTGATSGLGLATAAGLARLGATVHLVVRDTAKAGGVVERILTAQPTAQVQVHRCDVGDLDDVRRFTDAWSGGPLDVLVHNAGVMPAERTESAQGHELSMAVHVLGPVLMTERLLSGSLSSERSERVEGPRIVLVTSGGMLGQRLRADDPEYRDGAYSPTTAYARSKRAQVELLPVLDARWDAAVYATHPGWADTPGVVESLPTFHKLTGPVLRDADGGADTTVWLAATQPAASSGGLWHDRRPRPTTLLPSTRSRPGDVAAFWDWVREQTDLPERA